MTSKASSACSSARMACSPRAWSASRRSITGPSCGARSRSFGNSSSRLLRVVQPLGELVDVEQHRAQHVEVGQGACRRRVRQQHRQRAQHRRQRLVLVLDDLQRAGGASSRSRGWLRQGRTPGRRAPLALRQGRSCGGPGKISPLTPPDTPHPHQGLAWHPCPIADTTLMANAIRALAMDAVQQANSGHPGAPMGMAEIAVALWGRHLKHNPANPHWADRDRFVLSNGHGSMLHLRAAAPERLRPADGASCATSASCTARRRATPRST